MSNLRDAQMSILWISKKVYEPKDTVSLHKHNFYQLLLLLSGKATIVIDKNTYHISLNELCMIKKNKPHEYFFDRESVVIDIKFSINPKLVPVLNKYLSKNIYQLESADEFKALLEEALFLNENPCDFPLSLMELDSHFKYIILKLFSNQENVDSNSDHKLNFELREKILLPNEDLQILNYLQKNYSQPITLNFLSEKFSYSKNYIIKLFKKKFNLTPIQVLQIIRIEQAKPLLEYTNDSVAIIANNVGMEANYFTKLFKKHEEISPIKYRNQIRRQRSENITLMKDFDIKKQPEVLKEINIFAYYNKKNS
jgi:AraC-like DNA-binding protein